MFIGENDNEGFFLPPHPPHHPPLLLYSSLQLASATGEEFPITSSITCTTKNVIYDLWCNKCRNSATTDPGSDQYTGKTTGDGGTRFSHHKSDVNTLKDKAVSSHFQLPGHSSSDMRYLPFEHVAGGDQTLLASREEYWIKKKKTLECGINRKKIASLCTSILTCNLVI